MPRVEPWINCSCAVTRHAGSRSSWRTDSIGNSRRNAYRSPSRVAARKSASRPNARTIGARRPVTATTTQTLAQLLKPDRHSVGVLLEPDAESTEREGREWPQRRQPEHLDIGATRPIAENIRRLDRTPDHSKRIGDREEIEHDARTVHDATSGHAPRPGPNTRAFVVDALPRSALLDTSVSCRPADPEGTGESVTGPPRARFRTRRGRTRCAADCRRVGLGAGEMPERRAGIDECANKSGVVQTGGADAREGSTLTMA